VGGILREPPLGVGLTAGALVVLSVFLGGDLLSALVSYQAEIPPPPLTREVGRNDGEPGETSLSPSLAVLLRRESRPVPPRQRGQVGDPETELEPTSGEVPLEVELQGVMVGGGVGVAVLRVEGQDHTVGLGESAGSWKVVEIHPDHVVLARDGQLHPLTLSGAPVSQPLGQGPPVLPPPDQVPLPPAPLPVGPDPAQSVEAVATDLAVDSTPSARSAPRERLEVEAFLEQGAALARDVRGVMVSGPGRGVRLEFRNPANALAALGLKDGDVVLALNGAPIRTTEELYNSWLILRNTPRVEFEVLRSGKPLQVRHDFADEG